MIFISYSWRDTRLARDIAYRLTQKNVPVWIDYCYLNLSLGIEKQIVSAIEHSACILFLATQFSVQSEWVHFELSYAMKIKRKIYVLNPYIHDLRLTHL